jgi:hypothetical protein
MPLSVVGLRKFSALVRADGDPVVDGVYSRSDLSGQRHDVTVRGNADLLWVNLGTAFEGRLDVLVTRLLGLFNR